MLAQSAMKSASIRPPGITMNEYKKQALGASQQISMPMRDKYWREIKTDEKLERLRRFVHNLKSENEELRLQVFKLKKHTHDKDGKAVIVEPLQHGYPEGSEYPNSKSLYNNSEDFYI